MLSDANVPVRFMGQQQAKYSSLQFTVNCIAAIRYKDTMSNWFENHQPQRTQISTVGRVTLLSSVLSFKTRIKWPPVLTATASFPSVFFQLLQYSRQQGLAAYKPALITKNDFSNIFLRFVEFADQFCFRCKFSYHEKPFESSLTVAWFFWTNHNSLLRIATNEIASFCIDNRLRQMAFFVSSVVVSSAFE